MIDFSISTEFVPKLSNVEFSAVPSAYMIKENLKLLLMISLITILKSKGPMTDPCGTPINIGLTSETISPICTNCLRLLRYYITILYLFFNITLYNICIFCKLFYELCFRNKHKKTIQYNSIRSTFFLLKYNSDSEMCVSLNVQEICFASDWVRW